MDHQDRLQQARETINEVDRAMAALFVRRMEAVKSIAAYKWERGLPILDEGREREVLERNAALLPDEELRGYYVSFLQHLMDLSKDYQRQLTGESAAGNAERGSL